MDTAVQARIGDNRTRRLGSARSARRSLGVEGSRVTQFAPLRIAVLDRDSGFLAVLANRLERLGWEHHVLASTASTDEIAGMSLDALVVDPAMLGPRSWDWFESLWQAGPKFRVIVCTGSSTTAERVRALRMGADGWLSKPCHPEELVARIQAAVGHRRRSEPPDRKDVTIGEVEIRRDQYQAFVSGRSLNLTRGEFEMLELLAGAGNEPVERELMYERLWGGTMGPGSRSVDVVVHKLRRKLQGASPGWRYIHTHWGLGYRFAAEPAERAEEPRELDLVREPVDDRLAA
jgi:DNA-binding response OmpR family regulator